MIHSNKWVSDTELISHTQLCGYSFPDVLFQNVEILIIITFDMRKPSILERRSSATFKNGIRTNQHKSVRISTALGLIATIYGERRIKGNKGPRRRWGM